MKANPARPSPLLPSFPSPWNPAMSLLLHSFITSLLLTFFISILSPLFLFFLLLSLPPSPSFFSHFCLWYPSRPFYLSSSSPQFFSSFFYSFSIPFPFLFAFSPLHTSFIPFFLFSFLLYPFPRSFRPLLSTHFLHLLPPSSFLLSLPTAIRHYKFLSFIFFLSFFLPSLQQYSLALPSSFSLLPSLHSLLSFTHYLLRSFPFPLFLLSYFLPSPLAHPILIHFFFPFTLLHSHTFPTLNPSFLFFSFLTHTSPFLPCSFPLLPAHYFLPFLNNTLSL